MEAPSDYDLELRESVNNQSSELSVPLFPESRICSFDFSVTFSLLAQRHNLTYSSQTDLLKLISLILPTLNVLPLSSTSLINKIVNFKDETVIQHFCGSCMCRLGPGSFCAISSCKRAQEQRAVFIRIPLTKQLADQYLNIF